VSILRLCFENNQILIHSKSFYCVYLLISTTSSSVLSAPVNPFFWRNASWGSVKIGVHAHMGERVTLRGAGEGVIEGELGVCYAT
jgi:hypothetical protein